MKITVDIEVLRWTAMIAMLLDHVGFLFQIEHLRIIGRIAFPIFSYILVENIIRDPSSVDKYLWRLSTFGLISQLPFALVFETTFLNIMFQFLGFIIYLKYYKILGILISALSDYSILGFMYLLFLYEYLKYNNTIGIYVSSLLLNISFFNIIHILITLLATFTILSLHVVRHGRGLPYYFFYLFYPIHIILIYIAKYYI